jgi:hypothetical protein
MDCIAAGSPDCLEVVDAHSSAVGLMFQASSCLEASGCDAVCPQ